MIPRVNTSITIKLLMSDEYENTIRLTQTDCDKIKGTIINITGVEDENRYSKLSKLKGPVVLDNITFKVANDKYCVFEHEPLSYSKYITKLYINKKLVTLDEQVGQQLIFQVSKLPEVFKFTAGPIALIIFYAVFMIFLAFGVPYLAYWLVDGRFYK